MVNKEILAFLDGKQKILDASFVFHPFSCQDNKKAVINVTQ